MTLSINTVIDEAISLGEALLLSLRKLRRLKQEESKALRLWKKIPALLKYMHETGAKIDVFHDGSGQIIVYDADGDLVKAIWYFSDIRDLANALEEFPSFSTLVRIWECRRPTPRAGNYRDRSTWETTGRLIPTQWNGRGRTAKTQKERSV